MESQRTSLPVLDLLILYIILYERRLRGEWRGAGAMRISWRALGGGRWCATTSPDRTAPTINLCLTCQEHQHVGIILFCQGSGFLAGLRYCCGGRGLPESRLSWRDMTAIWSSWSRPDKGKEIKRHFLKFFSSCCGVGSMSLRRLTAPLRRVAEKFPNARRKRDLLLAIYRGQKHQQNIDKAARRVARRRRWVNLAEVLEEKYWAQKDVRFPSRLPSLSLLARIGQG